MNSAPRFDIQQVLSLTWKPGKILLQTGNLILAYFVVLFFRWLAPAGSAWLARILIFVGWLIAYFIILAGLTRVTRITLKELGVRARETTGGVLSAPVKIFAVIAALAVGHILIDLIGQIPYVGELCWMFSPVVNVPLAAGIVFAAFSLIFGLMLLPTIISLGREGPVSILIDFIRTHTLRFLGHFLIALTAGVVILAILALTFNVSGTISSEFMGDKYGMIRFNIPHWARACPQVDLPWHGLGGAFGGEAADRWTMVVAGFVFGALTWLIRMAALGVILVNFCVAGTISYLALEGPPEEDEEEDELVPEEAAPEEKKPAKKAAKKAKAPDKEQKQIKPGETKPDPEN